MRRKAHAHVSRLGRKKKKKRKVHVQPSQPWSLCLTKYHAMKMYSLLNYTRHDVRSGGIASSILNVGIRWRWVDRLTPRSLYPRIRSPRYPLGRRLGGPQSGSYTASKKMWQTAEQFTSRCDGIVRRERGPFENLEQSTLPSPFEMFPDNQQLQ
jgi:hypothetical protein